MPVTRPIGTSMMLYSHVFHQPRSWVKRCDLLRTERVESNGERRRRAALRYLPGIGDGDDSVMPGNRAATGLPKTPCAESIPWGTGGTSSVEGLWAGPAIALNPPDSLRGHERVHENKKKPEGWQSLSDGSLALLGGVRGGCLKIPSTASIRRRSKESRPARRSGTAPNFGCTATPESLQSIGAQELSEGLSWSHSSSAG